jgi:hypothetical protein
VAALAGIAELGGADATSAHPFEHSVQAIR